MEIAATINRAVAKIVIALLRKRAAVWILTAAALLSAVCAVVAAGHYTNDFTGLFPEDSRSARFYSVLQGSGLTDTVQMELDFGQPGAAQANTGSLNELADKLHGISGVAHVDFRHPDGLGESVGKTSDIFTQFFDPGRLNGADTEEAVKNARRRLVMLPGAAGSLRADPFGWSGEIFSKMQEFRQLSGMNFSLEHPFLTDPEARFALFNLTIRFSEAPDSAEIERLLAEIRSTAETICPDAEIYINSPLVHTLENERIVKRDVQLVCIISAAALILLFLALFRKRLEACWIPVLSFMATVVTAGVMALLFDRIYWFVLGLGGGIAGLAVDQGIHVMLAFTGRFRVRRTARLFVPLFLSVLTTAAVFAVLASSGIKVCVQLGIFVGLTLLLNFLFSFFLLPSLQRKTDDFPGFRFTAFGPSPRTARIILLIWLLITAAAVYFVWDAGFDFRLAALDGTPPELLARETEFRNRWQNPDAGEILLVSGKNRDEVLNTCRDLRGVLHAAGIEKVFNPADLCRTESELAARRQAWQSPEVQAQLDDLQKKLQESCRNGGLPETFFDPFFAALRQDDPQMPAYLRMIPDRTIQETDTGVTAMLWVDTAIPEKRSALIDGLEEYPGTALLSPESFQTVARNDFMPLLRSVLTGALAVLAAILLISIRPLRAMPVVLLPGITALLWCIGALTFFGIPLNMVHCLSFILLLGLVLDYGIMGLHYRQNPRDRTIPAAIFLSAVTTLFATGALLFSCHPVLFHAGLILSGGIFVAALTALWILPAFRKSAVCLICGCAAAALSSCASVPDGIDRSERILSKTDAVREWSAFTETSAKAPAKLWSMRADLLWHQVSLLLAVQYDPVTKQFLAVGMTGNGVPLFRIRMQNGVETEKYLSPMIPEQGAKYMFGTLAQDLGRIFLADGGDWNFDESTEFPVTRELPDGEKQTIGGKPLQMISRHAGEFPGRKWRVSYSVWDPETGKNDTIEYKNYDTGCTFTLHPRDGKR